MLMLFVAVCNWQEFEKEAIRKKQVVETLIELSSVRDAELTQLTDAWELVRRLEINRSARLHEALQLVSDTVSFCIESVFQCSSTKSFRQIVTVFIVL